MRRRMLLSEEEKKEDAGSGKKTYIFQNGSLQNGAKFESSRASSFLNLKGGYGSQSDSMIQDGAIVLKGDYEMHGEEFPITYYDEDGLTKEEMREDFLKKLTEKYGEEMAAEMGYSALRMLESSEREGVNTGYIFTSQTPNYGMVYGTTCNISLKEMPNFNFSIYKNIGFNIKDYKKTSNGKGSVSLSISNTGKDKKLIEFSDDGPIVCPLGDDLDDYNIIKFSTKAQSGIGYKITEIYLEE